MAHKNGLDDYLAALEKATQRIRTPISKIKENLSKGLEFFDKPEESFLYLKKGFKYTAELENILDKLRYTSEEKIQSVLDVNVDNLVKKETERLLTGIENVAHEMRGPTTAIGSFIILVTKKRFIQDHVKEEFNYGKKAEYLKKAVKTADKLIILLNQISDSAKEKVDANPSILNLYDIVEDEVEFLATTKKGRIYQLIKPEQDIIIYADKVHTEQVVSGLAKNAFEAIDGDKSVGKGILTINISSKGSYAYTMFHNNQKIPDEHMPFIFDRLYTTKKDGLGIGLNLYRKLMASNNGEITVNPTEEEGTTFTMKFPLYKGQKISAD